jgi:integrase
VSTHQLPDGRWICKFPAGTIPDQPTRTKEYFGRGSDGEKAAARRNAELGVGKVARKTAAPLFSDLAVEYLRAREGTMSPSTFRSFGYMLDAILIPYLGNIPADRITHATIDAFIRARQKDGVKNRTIRDQITYIHTILNHAVKNERIVFNQIKGHALPRDDSERVRPPTAEEFASMVKHASPHIRRVLLLAYYCSARPGPVELFSLQWKDVDLAGKTIMITSAQKGGLPLRQVPIADSFLPILTQWHEEDLKSSQRYIIHYNGQRIYRMHHGWESAKRKAGITRRLRPYDIRHMSASVMLEQGADLKTVSKILGHKNIMQTVNTYQHISDKLKRDAVSKL